MININIKWNSSCRCESDRCCRVGGFRVQRGVQRGNWDWCFLRSYVIGQLDCGARCSTPPGRAWIGRL
ncbi:3',5'-cyclic-nucleotide phosphodiesterase [Trichinella spiralis]|uniref:3',5'-cyclic-nucleotide phosphodiesterase n=1 Tax=Trichinella spiralis TaxID=6334 RepID=A0ABR3K5D3_TRISP